MTNDFRTSRTHTAPRKLGIHNPRTAETQDTQEGEAPQFEPVVVRAAWFRLSSVPPAVLILASLLPYALLPAAHLASYPDTATGFYHEELPYYVANGRAAFERGNGFLYPNPYDADANAPSIYAHWYLWGLGLLPAKLNADPGDVMLTFLFFCSIAFAMMTWQLVRAHCPPETEPHGSFLLAMWGGGLLSLGGLIAGMLGRTNSVSTMLQFDPGQGLWFLNWGRNAIFATEAAYHALVAGCWICEMKGKRLGGTLCCAALATTHPWSGLELLLILSLWRGVRWVQTRDREALLFLVTTVLMLAAFLGYYKIWLPQFTHHQKIEDAWELDWSLPWLSALLGYSLVLIPAAVRGWRATSLSQRFAPWTQSEQFLLCALVTAVCLVFHDRIIRPVQPLHFTRGYLWMPLFLLGLPVLHEWWQKLIHRGMLAKLSAAGLLVAAFADNGVFAVIHSDWLLSGSNGFHLAAADREILRLLNSNYSGAVVLTDSNPLNYLLPTYANVRPWIGHPFNTPDNPLRRHTTAGVFRENSVSVTDIPPDVDCLLVLKSRDTHELQNSSRWVRLDSHNPKWDLWGQAKSVPQAAIDSEREAR